MRRTPEIGADDVVSALRECSDAFSKLEALFAAIETPGTDAVQLAGLGKGVCFDFSNYADEIRETAEKCGIRP